MKGGRREGRREGGTEEGEVEYLLQADDRHLLAY